MSSRQKKQETTRSGVQVTLTEWEMMSAAVTGSSRQIEALKQGLRDRPCARGESGWGLHVEGALGELAFAKALNLYWACPVNTFKTIPDVGEFEVRTRSVDSYDLIVRNDDADDRKYALVVGKAPKYRVIGWLYGHEAKQEKWIKDHGGRSPAFFVPQSELRPFEGT